MQLSQIGARARHTRRPCAIIVTWSDPRSSSGTAASRAGIGELDLGLERSGFTLVGAVENDAAARRSLALNRPRLPFLEPHDINEVARDVRPEHLGFSPGELALLAAGRPASPSRRLLNGPGPALSGWTTIVPTVSGAWSR